MARPSPRLDAVFFDLDGTLADTLPALARALNAVAARAGGHAISDAALKPFVSFGARAMLQAAFPAEKDPDRLATLHTEFLDLYAQASGRPTPLFAGIADVISALAEAGIRWGIITNKRSRFTDPLVTALDFPVAPSCVVSGDTAHAPKPDPAPMRLACQMLSIEARAARYVGDARTDIVAAHACAMPAAAARWGYLPTGEDPADWNADCVADRPADLLPWLLPGRC